jgi:hypothetical protein
MLFFVKQAQPIANGTFKSKSSFLSLLVYCNASAVNALNVGLAIKKIHFPLAAVHNQGDKIGGIFAHWAIVYFLKFDANYKSSPIFLGYYFPR